MQPEEGEGTLQGGFQEMVGGHMMEIRFDKIRIYLQVF